MLPSEPTVVLCPGCRVHLKRAQYDSMNSLGTTAWLDGYADSPMALPFHIIQVCPHCGHVYRRDSVRGEEDFPFADQNPWSDDIAFEEDPGYQDYTYALEHRLAASPAEEIDFLTRIWWAANDRRRDVARQIAALEYQGPPHLSAEPVLVEKYLLEAESYIQEVESRVDYFHSDPQKERQVIESWWEYIGPVYEELDVALGKESGHESTRTRSVEQLSEAERNSELWDAVVAGMKLRTPEQSEAIRKLFANRHQCGRRSLLRKAREYRSEMQSLDCRMQAYQAELDQLRQQASEFEFTAVEKGFLDRLADLLLRVDNTSRAELLRELGDFEGALQSLSALAANQAREDDRVVLISQLCEQRDRTLVCTWIPEMELLD